MSRKYGREAGEYVAHILSERDQALCDMDLFITIFIDPTAVGIVCRKCLNWIEIQKSIDSFFDSL